MCKKPVRPTWSGHPLFGYRCFDLETGCGIGVFSMNPVTQNALNLIESLFKNDRQPLNVSGSRRSAFLLWLIAAERRLTEWVSEWMSVARGAGGAEIGGRNAARAGAAKRAVQAADRCRPRLPARLARLLRAGPAHRVAGHARPPLQPRVWRHRRLRAHVLRTRLQRASPTSGGSLQLQVPLVLLRPVSEMPPNCRGVRVPMTAYTFTHDDYSYNNDDDVDNLT